LLTNHQASGGGWTRKPKGSAGARDTLSGLKGTRGSRDDTAQEEDVFSQREIGRFRGGRYAGSHNSI